MGALDGLVATAAAISTTYDMNTIPTATTSIEFAVSTATRGMETATAVATAVGEMGVPTEGGKCQLLGPFAIFIQGALGALALLSLVFKRWRERPQRPLKIWAFDVSKQVVGSILLHLANLLMSMLSSGELTVKPTEGGKDVNPCSFYLLNIAIDTTIGIPILIVLLRLLTHGALLTPLGSPPESIRSGNYGQPPKAIWWLKQSLIYFVGLLGMKLCVFFIFKICPWIINVGDWALRWTEGNEMVQVFFVMLFFPVIMNAMQYYIIDGFIKNQKPSDHEPIPSEDGEADEDAERSRRQRNAWDASFDSEDEAEVVRKPANGSARKSKSKKGKKLRVDQAKVDEYDPKMDGDDTPTAVDSGSGSSKADKEEGESLLGKGLLGQSKDDRE